MLKALLKSLGGMHGYAVAKGAGCVEVQPETSFQGSSYWCCDFFTAISYFCLQIENSL